MTTTSKRRSVILFLAAVIALACFIYLVSYMGGTAEKMDSMSSGEKVGTSIAMGLATPCVVASGIGTLFACLGWLMKVRGFALTAGIVFIVAIVLMIPWFMFHIVQMILCFIAYARMK